VTRPLAFAARPIGTLVERYTRFAMLLHLPRLPGHRDLREHNGPALAGHGGDAVWRALVATLGDLPGPMRKTLTWDQGAEMAQHAAMRNEIGAQVYFCEPRSPWQRRSNENLNGLLRQYFPKAVYVSR
jgi:IS30 family transposase